MHILHWKYSLKCYGSHQGSHHSKIHTYTPISFLLHPQENSGGIGRSQCNAKWFDVPPNISLKSVLTRPISFSSAFPWRIFFRATKALPVVITGNWPKSDTVDTRVNQAVRVKVAITTNEEGSLHPGIGS
mmetsp:Transcript_67804/g.100475  ORF Transcript_67804/g.100475 Transcript_67804/m.100475 type:complete len:130 (-) Transcript_67804:637-1026(-)